MEDMIWTQGDLSEQYRIINSLIKEQLFHESTLITENNHYINIQYRAHILQIRVKYKGALARYTFSGKIKYRRGHQETVIDNCEELLEVLRTRFDLNIAKDLYDELISSRDGFVMTYRQFESRKSTIQATMKYARLPMALNFIGWLHHMQHTNSLDTLTYSESLGFEGHPTHPLSKTKLSLSEQDIKRYAPEFERVIPLNIMLIRKDVAHASSMRSDEQFILKYVIPDYRYKLRAFIEPLNKDLEDYFVIFVHPWQYHNIIVKRFISWMDQCKLIPTPFTIDSKATLAFRTMSLIDRPYHVKLPVNIQMTSAVRTVGAATTMDGPRLSYQLQELAHSYPNFQIAKEPYGIHAVTKDDDERQLACIIRQKPSFNQQGIALVSASLVNINPIDNRNILESYLEWVGDGVCQRSVEHFIQTYAQQLIRPLIAYIQRYGVALEAHMQNTVVQLGPNYEMGFLIRDIGGARIDLTSLSKVVRDVKLNNQSLIAHDIKEVIQKFQHAIIQNQFGELIHHLAQYDYIDERKLYRIVQETIDQAIDDSRPHAQALRAYLFGQTITVKSLLRMRMEQRVKKYKVIDLDNPIRKEV
ncbi:siderophore synthetase [Staphylococcus sp. SQ8-PEA]|uniref:Siderophore synthetase n=1 Tax=Staphylococcus marylandisciuri TaxID=2981529 RepID=A0ABT2QM90_9STAP|nr:IucA/IucC family protein [Staphylococcus marylandisciuri]MCU5745111.1 siderophore synthetase [Staphylococcus marylandisciuri]